jgi:8-oxo-dGTP diphosphatase
MTKPELCVGAVVRQNDALLLIRRGRGVAVGQWSIPGGRVEFGETMAAAVRREVAEETGLDVAVGDLIGWVERFGPDYHFVIADFHATVLGGALQAGDDASDTAWVAVAALPTTDLVAGLLGFLEEHNVLDS